MIRIIEVLNYEVYLRLCLLEAAVIPGEDLIVLGQLKANEFSNPVLEEQRFKGFLNRIGALD